MTYPNNESENSGDSSLSERDLHQIRDALKGLRFGSVNVIVQDGVVIQIDRTEKRRLRTSSQVRPSN